MRIPKPKQIKNSGIMKWVRGHRCILCFISYGIEAHHIKTRGAGGNDVGCNLIPLCHSCHMKLHNGKIDYFQLVKRINHYFKWAKINASYETDGRRLRLNLGK